jgi:hypothetical protein
MDYSAVIDSGRANVDGYARLKPHLYSITSFRLAVVGFTLFCFSLGIESSNRLGEPGTYNGRFIFTKFGSLLTAIEACPGPTPLLPPKAPQTTDPE